MLTFGRQPLEYKLIILQGSSQKQSLHEVSKLFGDKQHRPTKHTQFAPHRSFARGHRSNSRVACKLSEHKVPWSKYLFRFSVCYSAVDDWFPSPAVRARQTLHVLGSTRNWFLVWYHIHIFKNMSMVIMHTYLILFVYVWIFNAHFLIYTFVCLSPKSSLYVSGPGPCVSTTSTLFMCMYGLP